MANGRNGSRKKATGRVEGGFAALPWDVLDSAAYARLSHPARSLLVELARQFVRDNNGRLLTSMAYLSKRGWNSNAVITRASRELEAAGFTHQMVKGHRPNCASWWAVTWHSLDRLTGYDPGTEATFRKGAYRQNEAVLKNAVLKPSGGVGRVSIAPSGGVGSTPLAPSGGAIRPVLVVPPTPSGGDHLENHLRADRPRAAGGRA
jgi:hypothetical protein